MTPLDRVRAVLYVEADRTSPIVTQASRLELVEILQSLDVRSGAEIGVGRGRYLKHLCRGLPQASVMGVDTWKPAIAFWRTLDPSVTEAAYLETCAAMAEYPNATLIRATSAQAAAVLPDGSLDFVYIDGDHTYDVVRGDLTTWSRKVRAGGIIAGHDYRDEPNRPGQQVKRAVDDFTRERNIAPWFVLGGDTSPSYLWVNP